MLRHYLVLVENADYCRAITALFFGRHVFAIARLEWMKGNTIQKERRLCRFCKAAIETPEHAALQCQADLYTVNLRNHLREAVRAGNKWEIPVNLTNQSSLYWFKKILFNRDLIGLFAKYMYEISVHWAKTKMFIAPEEITGNQY
ncbi:hypothetical protein K435DRAFT_852183 [Dendrothele bispora CBS 962.96]|uniref:Reverse transcriptase zinc-binding domain-containing protein n=1 Tax=Dendrothele bispora (strain CBS 962.96) TaxID=1314807 RepID=A0A4S8MJX8_DENBC|nr:hypothetical protein K435DRAFT_852183 [Dendrothele bispora CBS 962.96]